MVKAGLLSRVNWVRIPATQPSYAVVLKLVTSFTDIKNDLGSIPGRPLVHGPIPNFTFLSFYILKFVHFTAISSPFKGYGQVGSTAPEVHNQTLPYLVSSVDRAFGYEPTGREFDSLTRYQIQSPHGRVSRHPIANRI